MSRRIDPQRLRPMELMQLANATPLGEVLDQRLLQRHRTSAGLRIAGPNHDPNRINAIRYTAYLAEQRHGHIRAMATRVSGHGDASPAASGSAGTPADGLTGYEAVKERARQRSLVLSQSGRDIGELPDVVDPVRKASCERDFRLFCETYLAQTFCLEWSDDHLKVISKIELAVLEGGLFAMAMPRGSGKSSLCEAGCLWALIYGHRGFVCVIGSDEGHAEEMLDSIKAELENNEVLAGDFPEVCYPILCLEGIHQRASGQLYEGRLTRIGWTAREIVLPTIPGSPASGAIAKVAGITGRIRGMKFKRPDGQTVRPSLVLIDDPQTDESARSPSQCQTRERILAGAILGLAGPGKKIAGLMTLTVVRPEDMADRILDREKHPQWQGERTKMVYSFPTNEALWREYAKVRAECLRSEEGIKRATEFYRSHREAMDEGSRVAWAARFNHDELSAIQHAMNLRYQDEQAFWAEYQNEPLPETLGDGEDLLTAEQIAAKVNGYERSAIPLGCSHLTMFIDVQAKCLFWLVVAWEDNFTGYVIDYGTEPDQKMNYFALSDVQRTLGRATPGAGREGSIYAGLERLCDSVLGREWRRDDGAMVRIDRCLIDANWGESTDVVYQFCRRSPFAGVLLPSHGRYVGASSIPFSEYKRKRGDRVGHNWRIPSVAGKRAVRHVVFDANYWKSFVQARLSIPMGDPGCLSLFGRASGQRIQLHRMMSEHLTAEYRVRTEGRGRTVDEWKLRGPGARDNHFLDCLVGTAVAASIQGAVLYGQDGQQLTSSGRGSRRIGGTAPAARTQVKLSEMRGKGSHRRSRAAS